MFGDLKSAARVKALDAFLADNSYIEGFKPLNGAVVPSQADTAVFVALKGAPGSDAQRWYNHIKSFTAGMKQFAKSSKYKAAYTAAGAADEEDDDACDLFRSDEEESEEKQKKTLLSTRCQGMRSIQTI